MQATAFLVLIALVVYSKAQATPGVSFSNLGGAGSYPQVVNQPPGTWPPPCNVAQSCQQTTVNIPAQPLAPFHEEISIQLRGPLQMTRIAVYQTINGQQQLVSNWQPNMPMLNMVFLMNSANDWSVCQGNALGFANAAGDTWSPTSQNFGGYLAGGLELTVMSGVPCNGDCGWYRGTGYHGWAGDKMFVIETSMPTSTNGNDMPAVWSLNAKIPRTGQYGCNCGRSGCGEFDIAEVLSNGDDKAYQTLYSYNGNIGSPAYFPRPFNTPATYVVHYSMADNKIFAVNLPGGCFQYGSALSTGYLANIHALATDVNAMYTSPKTNLVGTCPSGGAATSSPTVVQTTVTPTTVPTTVPPTTVAPTTVAPTTVAPTTTIPPTTVAPTTRTPTTVAQTTKPATTQAPTTVLPTTVATTIPATTAKATTPAPTTTKAPTAAPTTKKLTTSAPTTIKLTTSAPTTKKATTTAPTTKLTTSAPGTTKRVTSAPTTKKPLTSSAPTTGLVLCGNYYCASCCNDIVQGPVCIYQPDLYVCASGHRLCGVGQDVCGTACYDTSMYACSNGNIVQK